MKKLAIGLLAAATLVAPAAFADSLTVNGDAAMAGSFGLQLDHDNSSRAYVQDNTPNLETVYRFEMLFKINDVSFSGAPANFRQVFFAAASPNPGPISGASACPDNPPVQFTNAIRGFHYQLFGGATQAIEIWMAGAFCGDVGIGGPADGRFFIADDDTNANGEVKICVEVTFATDGFGRASIQDEDQPCFSGTVKTRSRNNGNLSVDRFLMGTAATNFFGANETVEYYFDDFASFRTLAP